MSYYNVMEITFPTFRKLVIFTRNFMKKNVAYLAAMMLAIYGLASLVWLWRFITVELHLGNLENWKYLLNIHPTIIVIILYIATGVYLLFSGAFKIWSNRMVGVLISIRGLFWMAIPGIIISSTYSKGAFYKIRYEGDLQFNYRTLILAAWVLFNLVLYLILTITVKKLPLIDGNKDRRANKTIVLLFILIISIGLGYSYYWSKKSPLLAYKNRSKQNIECEYKCQIAARESYKYCGNDCWDGAPIYAFNRKTKVCLMRSDLTGPGYFDFYVKDCNTNEFIKRWNVSGNQMASTTWSQIQNQTILEMQEHNAIIEKMIGKEGEIFLLGYQ